MRENHLIDTECAEKNLTCHLSGYSSDREFDAKTYLTTVDRDLHTFYKSEGSMGDGWLVRRRGRLRGVITSLTVAL